MRVVPLGGQAPYRVDLFVDGDWVGRDEAAPYLPAWPERVAGRHELKAKVTDTEGTVRYSAAVPLDLGGATTNAASLRKVWPGPTVTGRPPGSTLARWTGGRH